MVILGWKLSKRQHPPITVKVEILVHIDFNIMVYIKERGGGGVVFFFGYVFEQLSLL